jgi:CheY-like chemotaxis protein
MRGRAPIRILTVDDHELLREGVAALLASEPDMAVVGGAGTGREAIQQFRALRPDITLMDLRMPDMSGVEAIIAIRAEFPDAQFIVLTTCDQGRCVGILTEDPRPQGARRYDPNRPRGTKDALPRSVVRAG